MTRTRQWTGVLASLRLDDRIVIAVSGGADSVALAWILRDLGAPYPGAPSEAGAPEFGAPDQSGTHPGWRVVGIVHVNHGLRGDDAEADEAFCRDLAARLSWPIHVTRVDVRARARERRHSIEAAARALRYESFDEAMAVLGATVVATAHTMDDQAETVLLRLLRGAGSRGLSAVRRRRGRIVRPLLDYRRSELRLFLASRQEPFRSDASNLDLSIPRNRLRHDVMPMIERFAPGAVPALARCAALSADDEAVLEQLAADAELRLRVSAEAIDARQLAALPAAVARRVVRRFATRLAPEASWSARHLEAVRTLAASGESAESRFLDLPGANIERRGNVITFRAEALAAAPPAGFDHPLAVPGSTDIPEAGVTIEAQRVAAGSLPAGSNKMMAALDAGAIVLPLRVRSRRPGDRLRPLGAPGRRKLQDLLVDRRIPREARDRVPIVVDAAGRIVWVAGVTIAEECRDTASGAGMVILELTKR